MEFCGGGSLQDIYHSERDTHTHTMMMMLMMMMQSHDAVLLCVTPTEAL